MQKTAKGRRFGENHQNAILTDHEVEQMRRMRDELKMSIRKLAAIFEVGKTTAQDICSYRRR